MAYVYNPRRWQRAPGSSLASQSRLTEGPQVPGRPTLFFKKKKNSGYLKVDFWPLLACILTHTYVLTTCAHHLYIQRNTIQAQTSSNRIWYSSLSAVRIYSWFVCLLLLLVVVVVVCVRVCGSRLSRSANLKIMTWGVINFECSALA